MVKVAERYGVSFAAVQEHGDVHKWPVRRKGSVGDGRSEAARARRMRRKLEKEERRLETELTIVKAEDLEVLARKSLAADSARAKVAVSQRVSELLARLQDPSIPVRAAAQALNALAPVIKLVHGWHKEADIEGMKGAINLALIATTPEQLRALGGPKGKGEGGKSVEVEGELVKEAESRGEEQDGRQ